MRNYIILGSVLLTIFIGGYGCGNHESENETNPDYLVSESSLATSSLKNVHEGHTVLLNLEHPQSYQTDGDLKNIGSDCYTFKPTKEFEAKISIDPQMPIEILEITDRQSSEYYSVDKDNNETTYLFQKGTDYEICVHHDGKAEHNQTLTMKFDESNDLESSLMTMNTSCDLRKSDLTGCTFQPGNTSCSWLSKTGDNLPTTFMNCDLSGSILNHTQINISTYNAKFNNITVNSETVFDLASNEQNQIFVNHMQMEDVDLTVMPDENFLLPKDIKGISFENSTIGKKIKNSDGHLEDINFKGADLSGVTWSNVKFDHVNFTNALLTQAKILDSLFKDTVLNNTNFKDATLSYTDFSGARIEKVDFSGATLLGTNFDNTQILNCIFENADTNADTTVRNADLSLDMKQLSFLATTKVDMSYSTQDVIKWSYSGKPSSEYKDCSHWNENANTCSGCYFNIEDCCDADAWDDNYLCSKTPISLSFDSSGHRGSQQFEHLSESSDRSWGDNYLRYDNSTYPINFHWKSYGRVAEKLCVNVKEPGDDSGTWHDNFLCFDFGG